MTYDGKTYRSYVNGVLEGESEVAFTPHGHRLGQGGGFYDKWLGAHPDVLRFGLAWDMQEVPELPVEPSDALQFTDVVPSGKIDPEACEHVTLFVVNGRPFSSSPLPADDEET